jgi:MFS family permease
LDEDDSRNAVAVPTASFVVDKEWAATEWTLLKVLRNPRFWALFFTNFLIWGIVEQLLVAHQVACAIDIGFPATVVATMVTVFGIMVALGVLGGGFLSDRLGRELIFSTGSIMIILAIVVLLLLGSSSPTWMLFLYGVALGIGLGIDGPVLTAALADMFQGRNFGAINGLAVMGFGLAGALSPWLGGLIFDITGSYRLSFPSLIAATCLSIVLIWLAGPGRVRQVPGKAPKSRLE